MTAYLEVAAAPGSAGTTPVSVTVGAPGGHARDRERDHRCRRRRHAASFADRGHLAVTEGGAPLLSLPAAGEGMR